MIINGFGKAVLWGKLIRNVSSLKLARSLTLVWIDRLLTADTVFYHRNYFYGKLGVNTIELLVQIVKI